MSLRAAAERVATNCHHVPWRIRIRPRPLCQSCAAAALTAYAAEQVRAEREACIKTIAWQHLVTVGGTYASGWNDAVSRCVAALRGRGGEGEGT
jgi:hypothetical protein